MLNSFRRTRVDRSAGDVGVRTLCPERNTRTETGQQGTEFGSRKGCQEAMNDKCLQVLIADALAVHEDPGFLHALETMQFSFTSIASGLTSIAQPNVRNIPGNLWQKLFSSFGASYAQDAPQINNKIHDGIAYYVESLICRFAHWTGGRGVTA